jgi:hypothetical protein
MSTWGFDTATKGSASVGTASAQLLAANTDRRYLRVSLVGTAAVYLNLGTGAAVVGEGIRLGTEGGERTVELKRSDGNLWTGQINAIAGVDGIAVAYLEGE